MGDFLRDLNWFQKNYIIKTKEGEQIMKKFKKERKALKKWIYDNSNSGQSNGEGGGSITLSLSVNQIIDKAILLIGKAVVMDYSLVLSERADELHPCLRDHGAHATMCDALNKIRSEFIDDIQAI